MEQNSGLLIRHHDRTTRLKWHRLRRKSGDPLFSPTVMAEGFRLGASMEIDLRVRADGGFAVLHDDILEGETSGHGRICDCAAGDLASLTVRDGGHPVILSEGLAGMIVQAHPDALLQFDMKDDLALIGARGIDHLRDHFTGSIDKIIVSGSDLDLIIALKTAMPDLKRGIDPSDKLEDIQRDAGWTAVEQDLIADLKGPTEPDTVYLYWPLLLQARQAGLDLISLCHDHGRRVDAWTFNMKSPADGFSDAEWTDFSRLMALEPDQITTDVPVETERDWVRRTG